MFALLRHVGHASRHEIPPRAGALGRHEHGGWPAAGRVRGNQVLCPHRLAPDVLGPGTESLDAVLEVAAAHFWYCAQADEPIQLASTVVSSGSKRERMRLAVEPDINL